MQFWLQFFIQKELKECFFIGKTKENQRFQYQQSYMSYKSYIEQQNKQYIKVQINVVLINTICFQFTFMYCINFV